MSERKLLPPGTYRAVAVERSDDQGLSAYARWSLTKSGNRQVFAFFRILGQAENTIVPWYGSFAGTVMGKSNKTVAERTVESLRYMGLKGDDFNELESQKLDQIVSLEIEHDEYEGNRKMRVAWVNSAGGGVLKITRPMSDADKRKFAALMNSSLAKVPEVSGERHVETQEVAAPNGAPAHRSTKGGHSDDPWESEQESEQGATKGIPF